MPLTLRGFSLAAVGAALAVAAVAPAAGAVSRQPAPGGAHTTSHAKTVRHTTHKKARVPAKKKPAAPTTDWASFSTATAMPRSFWTRSVVGAPTAPDSAAIVSDLTRQVVDNYNGVAAFNVGSYNTTVYTVGPLQARQNVHFDDCQNKGYVPSQLTGPSGWFTGVPVPADAVPANGTDAELTIYQPATDKMWEFWIARRASDGLHACWGGRMDHVSQSPGWFPGGGGATATGLPNAAGMVSLRDAQAGVINHAISIQAIQTRKGALSWPAQRGDGWSEDATAPVEGERFRLDPSVNVAALHLSPLATEVAVAAQKYGLVVTDSSGAVAIEGESSLPAHASTDPWARYMGGAPSYNVFAGFPWASLQALPLNYGS